MNIIRELLPIDNSIILHCVSSYLASIVASTIINPLFVIKTRKQVNNLSKINYTQGLMLTYVKNLEIGFQLSLFELLKNKDYSIFMASLIAKSLSTTLTYPIDTVRTIRRSGNQISIMNIYRQGGIRVFFNGYFYNSIRSIPSSVIALNVNYLFVRYYTNGL